MNSLNLLVSVSSPSPCAQCSAFPRRRSRASRRRTRSKNFTTIPFRESSSESKSLQLTIDLEDLSSRASSSLQSLYASSRATFHHFLSSGKDAYQDLRTLVAIDSNTRCVVLSCRRTTLLFLTDLLCFSFVFVFAFRVLLKLGSGFKSRAVPEDVVLRRDRSLGGREVVVGRRRENGEDFSLPSRARFPSVQRSRKSEELPKWWPSKVATATQSEVLDKELYQKEANKLIRVILDDRVSGRDIMEDDIIQLRHICRMSGIRVSIGTANIRDSLYRASIDLVLNICTSAPTHSASVDINGEDAREFLAGLADNIGLENIRAARMVSAAIAARVRSCFLQAWALEIQGNHSQAALDMSKICPILRIFPPEESSPEMEMVAHGLGKQLKVEQREFLLNLFAQICGGDRLRSAAEALGLRISPTDSSAPHERSYT